MKFKRAISILAFIIAILSLIACAYGIFSNQGQGNYEFKSLRGETVTIYGKGLYSYDSVSVVAQGIAQDVVTMVLCIPVLIISLLWARRNSIKGKLLLTGILGYFLYTYTSYVFLWMYNPLFLAYVIIMSASFFSFILSMMSFDLEKLRACFNEKMPVKFIGGFQIFFAIALIMMWLARIIPPLMNNSIPLGLEHYNTLVIQGMDLGFIVPAAIVSGILIIKKQSFGYLLSPVIIIKGSTLAIAITAMMIGQAIAGVSMSVVEIAIFACINLFIIYCLVLVLKNINEKQDGIKGVNKIPYKH